MTHILLSLSELAVYVNLPSKIFSISFCFLNARNWCWVLLVEGIVKLTGSVNSGLIELPRKLSTG